MAEIPVQKIKPCLKPIYATVRPPGSKSITNRALLISALASGESTLIGALDSEDTRVMSEALRTLGVTVERAGDEMKMVGCGGSFPVKKADIYVANSGTTARFLTAALAFSGGNYRLDGKQRMRSRPMSDLLVALGELGAEVVSPSGGCPPVAIRPARRAGSSARIAGNVSSQFLSALLMAAPLVGGSVRLKIDGELVSRPYIDMTRSVMKSFGVWTEVSASGGEFSVPSGSMYRPCEYAVEPDASAASYFFAIPAILGGQMTVRGLSRSSLQGDVRFVECLAAMGCRVEYVADAVTVVRPVDAEGVKAPLVGVDVDMNDISDTAQTLAVAALFAETPTRIRGIAHVRAKETDRISAVVTELRKFGARVDEFDDGLCVWPNPAAAHGARIATYDDHRMAMSFALAGLAMEGVEIENPECTAKTYPNFFSDLARIL